MVADKPREEGLIFEFKDMINELRLRHKMNRKKSNASDMNVEPSMKISSESHEQN